MAGQFNKAARPKLAGSFFNWESDPTVTVAPSVGGVVAVTATSDWGPLRTAVLLESFDEYTSIFGTSDTPLRRAVFGAFKGEGRPGHGGAGAVVAYRNGTAAAAPATRILNNTGTVAALTLTALFYGTRGNAFRVTTQASATAGKTDLLLFDGSLLVEKYTFTSTDMVAAAAAINASSDWVSATSGATGVALSAVSTVALAGGNDGAVLTTAEWIAVQNALDTERWAILAAHGLTDPTIRAAFVAWIQQRNALGKRSMAVLGGAAGEDMTTANTRSQAINDWDIVNVGFGTLHLDDLGVDVSTSEMVARVAGSIANRGETRDLIYARFADVSIVGTGPTLLEQESALAAGTTVFTQDTNTTAPVFIKEGVTTYADDSQSPRDANGVKTHQVADYKRIKNLRIQHTIELETDDWFTSGDIAGGLPVNDRVRAIVIGFVKGLYSRREQAEIVQPGWSVVLDTEPPPSDDDDFVQYRHGFHPTRTLRQMFNTARIG